MLKEEKKRGGGQRKERRPKQRTNEKTRFGLAPAFPAFYHWQQVRRKRRGEKTLEQAQIAKNANLSRTCFSLRPRIVAKKSMFCVFSSKRSEKRKEDTGFGKTHSAGCQVLHITSEADALTSRAGDGKVKRTYNKQRVKLPRSAQAVRTSRNWSGQDVVFWWRWWWLTSNRGACGVSPHRTWKCRSFPLPTFVCSHIRKKINEEEKWKRERKKPAKGNPLILKLSQPTLKSERK